MFEKIKQFISNNKKSIYNQCVELVFFQHIACPNCRNSYTYMEKQKDNSHFLKYCNCDYEKRGV